ncbi:MAG: hypothetical protein EOM18_16520, partial [Clostridia bacterium]|nr:hypothetical protein [Clostridia bacterium]
YDANGNVTDLVDTNGSSVAHYEYGPFGQKTTESGTLSSINPFRFSSKYLDMETGLYNYGYRFYNPQLGRWINRDPIGEDGGEGIYLFVDNNSIGYIDPFGLVSRRPAPPAEDPSPPNPYSCSKIKRWMNRYAIGFSDELWRHWLGGSGAPLQTTFDKFDKNSAERNAVYEDLLTQGIDIADNLSCGASKTTFHKTKKPKNTNKYTEGWSRKMINGWRFWYDCNVTSTRICSGNCCSKAEAICFFYAYDEVNFWPDDSSGTSSFEIPGGIRLYDQWILDCFPSGSGFEVTAYSIDSQERTNCVK